MQVDIETCLALRQECIFVVVLNDLIALSAFKVVDVQVDLAVEFLFRTRDLFFKMRLNVFSHNELMISVPLFK